MTTNLKLRIHLKSKIGEKPITIYNDIFDIQNGIAFFPIDKETWEVESVDRYVGNYNGRDIFENDNVQGYVKDSTNKARRVEGKIVYDENCMSLQIKESSFLYDEGQTPPLYEIENIEKI